MTGIDAPAGVQADISLGALAHNLGQVRKAAPDSRVLAVIKANGYGHGLLRVAQALDSADAFAVARIEEGVFLRQSGVTHPLIVLEGFSRAAELDLLAAHRLTPVIHHSLQVELLEQASDAEPLSAWLKMDSGMHRFGVPPERMRELLSRLEGCSAVREIECIMTHLACADERGNPQTGRQIDTFSGATAGLDYPLSVANSGGLLAWPESRQDWVRPGIMLYGVSPFDGDTADNHGLRPAMTLRAQLLVVNRHRAGDAIGYGGTWSCPEDMPVGVVGAGYGDGYPRHAASGTPVLVNGHAVPVIGRVSMDTLCVDLREYPNAQTGDPVVLWGEGLPLEVVAQHASTIGYELLCRLTPRVAFREVA